MRIPIQWMKVIVLLSKGVNAQYQYRVIGKYKIFFIRNGIQEVQTLRWPKNVKL